MGGIIQCTESKPNTSCDVHMGYEHSGDPHYHLQPLRSILLLIPAQFIEQEHVTINIMMHTHTHTSLNYT